MADGADQRAATGAHDDQDGGDDHQQPFREEAGHVARTEQILGSHTGRPRGGESTSAEDRAQPTKRGDTEEDHGRHPGGGTQGWRDGRPTTVAIPSTDGRGGDCGRYPDQLAAGRRGARPVVTRVDMPTPGPSRRRSDSARQSGSRRWPRLGRGQVPPGQRLIRSEQGRHPIPDRVASGRGGRPMDPGRPPRTRASPARPLDVPDAMSAGPVARSPTWPRKVGGHRLGHRVHEPREQIAGR